MVKFKSRYFLIEILSQSLNQKIKNFDCAKFAHIIREQVEKLFGELGDAKILKNFQVKYLNDRTNLIIIRIGKEYFKLIQTALCLINNIDNHKIRLRVLGISGTIKKTEERAKRFLQNFKENFQIYNNNKDKSNNDNKDIIKN